MKKLGMFVALALFFGTSMGSCASVDPVDEVDGATDSSSGSDTVTDTVADDGADSGAEVDLVVDTTRALSGWLIPGASYASGGDLALVAGIAPVFIPHHSSGGDMTLTHLGLAGQAAE